MFWFCKTPSIKMPTYLFSSQIEAPMLTLQAVARVARCFNAAHAAIHARIRLARVESTLTESKYKCENRKKIYVKIAHCFQEHASRYWTGVYGADTLAT